MEDLLALVSYVTPNKLKRLAFFGGGTKELDSQTSRFYQDLAQGKFKTDKQACQAYYKRASDQRYRRLRARLVALLSNAVLLVEGDYKKLGKAYEANVFLKKQLHVAELLWNEGYYKGAAVILEQHLQLAFKMEVTDYLAAALPLLRYRALVYLRDEQKFNVYDQLAREWIAIRAAEEDIKGLHDRLMIKYAISTLPDQRVLAAIISEGLQWHHQRHQATDTAVYIFYYYLVKFTAETGAANYRAATSLCWEAIAKLKEKPQVKRAYLRTFLSQIAINAIRFEDFQESRRAVLEYVRLSSEGSDSWFRIHQIYLYICIQSEHHKEAVRVSNQVFGHKKFRGLPAPAKERFYLLRAFLYWLIESGSVEAGNERVDKFRFKSFYSEMVIFSKDKQGFNIPLLILQILWYINAGSYEEAKNRVDNLSRYSNRHLRNIDGLKRTYYFVKVMLQLSKADFHRSRFEQLSNRYYEALIQHPRLLDQQSLEVEIIPYERLYRMIINQLENVFR